LQVFVCPFVFPKFRHELPLDALPQQEKIKNSHFKKLLIAVGAMIKVVQSKFC
jgi:hypothetical protein